MTVFNSPVSTFPELKANIGLYAQDQWAFQKFTFNYGIRYEYLQEEIPEQDRVAGRFAPAAHYAAITCKSMPGMTCWSNWAPRLGVAYDVRTWSDTDRSGLNLPTNNDGIAQDNKIGPSATTGFGQLRNRSLDPAKVSRR